MDATQPPMQRAANEDLPVVGRCALYRFYAPDDALLYIGITQELPTRLRVHDKKQPWYHEVARVTVEHYATREAALIAETAAIRAEKPRYNVVHNWSETQAKRVGVRGSTPQYREVTYDYEVVCVDLEGTDIRNLRWAKYLKKFHDGRMVRETQGPTEDGWAVFDSVEVPSDGPERDTAVQEFDRLRRRDIAQKEERLRTESVPTDASPAGHPGECSAGAVG